MLTQGSDALVNLMQSVNQLYFVVFGCVCLFGVVGCAMMESGISRSKNSLSGVSKNLAALAISVALYWLLGYSFSDFWGGNGFLGYQHFVGHNIMSRESGEMFFFACVAGLVAAFVSRGLVERMSIVAHIIMAIVLTGFCFPVVAHWIWSVEGWLYKGTQVDSGRATFMDDAGCCAIHLMVACIIFIGCLFLGERYKKGQNSSLIIASLGGLMTIIAIIGLHMGLRRSIAGTDGKGKAEGFELGTAALNTLAGGTAGSGICLLVARFYKNKWDVLTGLNGFMAGQISVAAGVYHFYPGVAFVVGLLGGLSYLLWVQFSKFFIDDPLKAFAVHFGGGLWGIFAAPLMIRFDSLFYEFSFFHFQVIGWNTLGAFVVIIWTLFLFGILFLCLKLCGILRITKEAEKDGLDLYYMDKKAISVRERAYSERDARGTKSKSKDKKTKKVKKEKKVKTTVVNQEVHYNVTAGADANIYENHKKSSSDSSSSNSEKRKIRIGGGIKVNVDLEGGHKTDSSSSSSSSHNAKANVVFGSDQEIKVNLNIKKDDSSSSSSSDSKKAPKITYVVRHVSGSESSSSSSESKKSGSGGIKINLGGGVKVHGSGSDSSSSESKKSASGGIKINLGGGVRVHGSGSESSSSESKKSASGGININLGGGVRVHGSGSDSSSSESKKSASGGININLGGGVRVHGSGSGSDSSSSESKKSGSGGIKIGFGVSGGVKAHGSGSDSSSSESKKSDKSGSGGIRIGFGRKKSGSSSD